VTPTLDATPHIDAAVAAIKAVRIPNDVYPFGEVPGTNRKGANSGTEPATYLRVTVERRYMEATRMVGRAGRVAWRVSVRSASTNPRNTRQGLLDASTALNEARLVVAGQTSTPIQHETTNDLDYDDGYYLADVIFTYVC